VIPLLVSLGLTGCLFIPVWIFAMEGVRTGDRPGHSTVSAVEADADGLGIRFTVHNPGRQAVLVGASLRRRSLRLWQSNAAYISVPRRTTRDALLPDEHTLVCVVEPGERVVFRLAAPRTAAVARRQELVVAIGEPDRLRVLHRAVTPPAAHHARPVPAATGQSGRWSVETVDADFG
jgi:hypothetical protein